MKQKYGEDFAYEISCDQMCGAGHYSMKGTIIVESQAEYNAWLKQQKAQYQLVMAAEQGNPANVPAASGDSTQQIETSPSNPAATGGDNRTTSNR